MLVNAFPQAKADRQQVTEEITASGTWTVPEGVTSIHVMCFGGGGGGNATCGGGGGYLAQGDFDVTPGTQYAITIGAGGAAKSAGGATALGDLLTADGGGAPTTPTTGSSSPYSPGRAGSGGTGGGGYGKSTQASGSFEMHTIYPSGSGQYGGDGGMVSTYGASNGSGTDTAHGGTSYYDNGYSNSTYTRTAYAGGGAGINGGNGGNGKAGGGGGGGYGIKKLATDGINGSAVNGQGGTGYGAGGGGSVSGTPGKGAQGICVIQYNKA